MVWKVERWLADVFPGEDRIYDAYRHLSDRELERTRMVDTQLRARDIESAQLDAMLTVPRHLVVPEPQRTRAYSDSPLPIGYD